MSYVYQLNGLRVSDTKYTVEPERSSDWDIHRSREQKILTVESRSRGRACSRHCTQHTGVFTASNGKSYDHTQNLLSLACFPRISAVAGSTPFHSHPPSSRLIGPGFVQMCQGLRGWITVALTSTAIPFPFPDASFSILPGSEGTT